MNKRSLNRLTALTLPGICFLTVVGLQLLPTTSLLRAAPDDDAAKNAAQKDANANKAAAPDRDRSADRNDQQDDRNTKRAWIGVRLEDRDNEPGPRDQGKSDNQKSDGIGVTAVYPNGPAARGGLQAGDRIQSINGKAVTSPKDVSQGIARIQPGAKAQIIVKRNNADQTLTVVVGDASAFRPQQANQGNFQQQSYSYGGQPGQGYPAQGYNHGQAGGYQQGQNPQGNNHYEGVPEHAMMLEYHRRNRSNINGWKARLRNCSRKCATSGRKFNN